jgi:hypothetical protein
MICALNKSKISCSYTERKRSIHDIYLFRLKYHWLLTLFTFKIPIPQEKREIEEECRIGKVCASYFLGLPVYVG